MKTVKMETIVAMRNEVAKFKMSLFKALENGTAMPTVDSNMILEKYITQSVNDLKQKMSLPRAKKISREILTDNMLDVLN